MLTDTYSTQSYPVVLPESGALDEGFLDQYTTSDVTLYYLRHPIQLLGLFEVGVRNAFFTRTDYSGNYEQSSGMPARAKALFLSIWSTFKERSAPQRRRRCSCWSSPSSSSAVKRTKSWNPAGKPRVSTPCSACCFSRRLLSS